MRAGPSVHSACVVDHEHGCRRDRGAVRQRTPDPYVPQKPQRSVVGRKKYDLARQWGKWIQDCRKTGFSGAVVPGQRGGPVSDPCALCPERRDHSARPLRLMLDRRFRPVRRSLRPAACRRFQSAFPARAVTPAGRRRISSDQRDLMNARTSRIFSSSSTSPKPPMVGCGPATGAACAVNRYAGRGPPSPSGRRSP